MYEKNSYLNQIELQLSHVISEGRSGHGITHEPNIPTYNEIESPDELKEVDAVINDLQSINWDFTTDNTSFLTHDIHPYPAKFIPQIPGHLIARLSLRGELVLDPFGGGGTTALEALRLGRRAISVDANPIGTLIGKVKTSNIDRESAMDLQMIKSAVTTLLSSLPSVDRLCKDNEEFIPAIPNINRWFPLTSLGELAFIRSRIAAMESDKARDIASLALSRIVISVSFQDSETRYASKPREIPQGESLRRYLIALRDIIQNVIKTQPILRFGVCKFVTADTRDITNGVCNPDTVDLIVTSPPYGNANDYHLYHRFRLFWLGYDPRQLARIEIGSHLRHQRESSGFDSYLAEIEECLVGLYKVLKPGRYAVFVVGDSVYKNVVYNGAESISKVANKLGFETICIIERQIHRTKRSFVAAGRRANTEKLLVLRKPPNNISVLLQQPSYRLWQYEDFLRHREVEAILGVKVQSKDGNVFTLNIDPYTITKARKLVFTHGITLSKSNTEPTWQAIIENGFAHQQSPRKNSKYVTHGLHPYKGKFYPQLAKALINISNLKPGAKIFDPFCGSGTTLLEGYLNGYQTYGCDMNPLAVKIAKAKIGILEVDPDIVREAVGTLVNRLKQAPSHLPRETEQFHDDYLDEINRWFPQPVVLKLNWLLRLIRNISEGVVRDFLEVVVSTIIRNVSQQDPKDLRIRKRKEPIQDADVFGLFLDALESQYERIERFWSVRGYSPEKFREYNVIEGDSRKKSVLDCLGIDNSSIDLILTSPPYATALPYIDTDRLSLLILFGMSASKRRPIERNLVGSREIIGKEREWLEKAIKDDATELPKSLKVYLRDLHYRVSKANVGFRRKNMPALLLRYFSGIDAVFQNCYRALRSGGEAMIVIGDNRMRVNEDYERIPTTEFLQDIALARGFELSERIDVSVTTENLVHIKNAITKNVVLRLKKP